MARRASKRRDQGGGTVDQLPSRKWRARYRDQTTGRQRSAPVTFDTKLDAEAWLDSDARKEFVEQPSNPTLRVYSEQWLAGRDLKPRTRLLYRGLLDSLVLPDLGSARLDKVYPATVRAWYATLNPGTPTRRAHAYSLLRSIYMTAVADDLVPANPCRIRGAGASKKAHRTQVLNRSELTALLAAMPERYRAMLLLAAWCALRFGELAELRRKDVDLVAQVIRVERAVTTRDGQVFVGTPKSEAGVRVVDIPPHILPALRDHLNRLVAPGGDALLFPAHRGGHLAPTTLYPHWARARVMAGVPELHFHDLRHTGLTRFAQTGATLAEIMHRGGHSTPGAAQRYQHVADRNRALAGRMSEMDASED